MVDAGSQVRIVERYTGAGRYFTNAVTEIVVGENATVEHVKLEEESPDSFHVATIQVQQARNSNFKSHNISLGGLLVRNDVNAVLSSGCEGTLNGLYLTKGSQHVDNHTVLDHAAPHAASHELYKGILDGAPAPSSMARFLFGKTRKKRTPSRPTRTWCFRKTRRSIPSPSCKFWPTMSAARTARPIGQLDEEALFYLRARGIDQTDARDLLIYAFARDVIDRIGIPSVREYLEKALFESLDYSRRLAEAAS